MTSKAEIRHLADVINKALEFKGANWRISVEWAYGRPRAYKSPVEFPDRADKELSPRLPTGKMLLWLEAFLEGMGA